MDHGKAATGRVRAAVCVALLCLWTSTATSATDGASGFAIRQSLVSNGGGFINDNCYRLRSAIGEAVLGVVGNSEFTLASGFLAETASTDDKLFRSGFETSTGICK